MHKNPIWLAFLLIVFMISLWFIFRAGSDLVTFFSLKDKVEAKIVSLNLESDKKGRFFVVASLYLEKEGVEGKAVEGPYPNRYAAEEALKSLSRHSTVPVYYNKRAPEKMKFERSFPYKSVLSAVVLVALSLYFYFLGLYVKRRKS